ncbi:hypothetical protein [Magnetococcus sp. PR-3]|uniref:hypothetical protein n=1 Tax=Magnetococcus sp. PR-3 TaxID=3120355 RepID=UPI002FCE1946
MIQSYQQEIQAWAEEPTASHCFTALAKHEQWALAGLFYQQHPAWLEDAMGEMPSDAKSAMTWGLLGQPTLMDDALAALTHYCARQIQQDIDLATESIEREDDFPMHMGTCITIIEADTRTRAKESKREQKR